LKKYVTISIPLYLKAKYDFAKVKEQWTQRMNLTDGDFMELLLETYPNPPKKKSS